MNDKNTFGYQNEYPMPINKEIKPDAKFSLRDAREYVRHRGYKTAIVRDKATKRDLYLVFWKKDCDRAYILSDAKDEGAKHGFTNCCFLHGEDGTYSMREFQLPLAPSAKEWLDQFIFTADEYDQGKFVAPDSMVPIDSYHMRTATFTEVRAILCTWANGPIYEVDGLIKPQAAKA